MASRRSRFAALGEIIYLDFMNKAKLPGYSRRSLSAGIGYARRNIPVPNAPSGKQEEKAPPGDAFDLSPRVAAQRGASSPWALTLNRLGLTQNNPGTFIGQISQSAGDFHPSTSPINGAVIARTSRSSPADYHRAVDAAVKAFPTWRDVPAPVRGQVVLEFGELLRMNKEALGHLVTLEVGKSRTEGLGEVQEMIDICQFAVGLSRQLYGVTTKSERPEHSLEERWHPLGVTGIISAFNFPVAVWAWNATLALACGNTLVWKPSEAAPLTAIACQKLLAEVLARHGYPEGVSTLVCGTGDEVGNLMASDPRISLLSYTGSTAIGRKVAAQVAQRLGKSILELGGNNGLVITANADIPLACQAAAFGSLGTAGQRCTSTRRVIVHDSVYPQVKAELERIFRNVSIGNPEDPQNLVGPLISRTAVAHYLEAIEQVKQQGGRFLVEGEALQGPQYPGGCYVGPSLAEVDGATPIVRQETFGPLLYLIRYSGDVHKAIEVVNDVPQGLSSAIFTRDMREANLFVEAGGAYAGIVNVNTGTSGAEIGLGFGGEKDTGGGRESGSDAWKNYMRRQSTATNYGADLPLAQGVTFDVAGNT